MMSGAEVSGLLYKRRGGFGKMMPNAWQYRFFAITKEGILLYFDTENADPELDVSKARGRLDLKALTSGYSMEPIEGAPSPYSIQISIPNDESWKLCADSKEVQIRWCKVLDKIMGGKNASRQPKDSVNESIEEAKIVDMVRSPPMSPSHVEKNAVHDSNFPVESKNAVQESMEPHLTSQLTVPSTVSLPSSSVPAEPPSSSVPAAGTKAGHGKKRLKLAAKKDLVDQGTVESALVLLIVNICFWGAIRSSSFISFWFYFLVANCVIAKTLKLRHERISKAAIGTRDLTAGSVNDNLLVSKGDSCSTSNGVEKLETTVDVDTVVESKTSWVNGKPTPGCTFNYSALEPKLSPDHTWSLADHRQFSVRIGPDYNRHKKKAPSGSPIYEPFAVDVFCAKQRVDNAASRFLLPEHLNIDTNNPHVPPVFVIQIQIPSEPPASMIWSTDDGPGWAVVMYFKITEDARNQLKNLATASPAIKLFAEWCEKAPIDPAWRGRFKVINSCSNLEELGFPSMIVSYNAKPVLIRRTGTIFKGTGYMEMDIHVHKFANLAKQSIYLISSRCAQMFMQIGFVIEGRDDKELPETLFACVAVNKPQEDKSEYIFDD